MKFSYYKDVFTKENSELSIENYIGFITHGANQDLVLNARAERQKGNLEEYKNIAFGELIQHTISPICPKEVIITNIAKFNN